MNLASILSGLLIALAAASAASSQTPGQNPARTHALPDGRTVSVADKTPPCDPVTDGQDPMFAIVVRSDCRDAVTSISGVSGISGGASIVVGRQPGETTPREYLQSVAADYWPHLSPAERDEEIRAGEIKFSGETHTMICAGAHDQEGTFGEVMCVLDQPRTQVIIGARSTGLQEAYGVMLMFLTDISIR